MKKYIPKSKDDVSAISHLHNCTLSEVLEDVPTLLKFMQDMHWEVADGVGTFFAPYANEIKRELLKILSTNDNEWKFGILVGLLAKSEAKLDDDLSSSLKRMIESPTSGEVEEGVDQAAKEIIMKKRPQSE
jgi:hypothetical protein